VWYKFSQSIDNLQQQLPIDNSDDITDEEYDFYEEADIARNQVLQDFMQNPKQRQSWNLIPASRLNKIWADYSKFGFVRDEAGIDYIAGIMIENTLKLYANTVFAGHTSSHPEQEAEMYDYQWNEQHDNDFADHIEDDNGAWRISDYAMNPLVNEAKRLKYAHTAEQKLQIIDRMLNIIHARSDIAGLFVEGGSRALDLLFSN